jgi:hypothetical protein
VRSSCLRQGPQNCYFRIYDGLCLIWKGIFCLKSAIEGERERAKIRESGGSSERLYFGWGQKYCLASIALKAPRQCTFDGVKWRL